MTLFADHPASRSCLLVRGREHLQLFLNIQNEPETREYLARYLPLTRGDEEKWLDKPQDTSDIVFVIGKKPCRSPIGSIGLHRIDWKNRRATTGAAILSKYWGQGLGSDAKMLLLAYAFLELGLNKVESRVLATNPRSQAYNRKCGYKQAGVLREHHFRNGEFIDEIVMEVHVDDWLPLWEKFQKGESRPKATEPFRAPDAWRSGGSVAPGVHG